MPSFLTPNRHPYSVRFSLHHPNLVAVAASQYYGLAGGGTLYILEHDDLCMIERKTFEWTDGLFDVVSWRGGTIGLIDLTKLSLQAWSPQSANLVLTGSGDGTVQLWNLEENKPVQVYHEHTKEIYSVNWSKVGPSPAFLTASWDTTIKLWDPAHPVSLNTYYGHSDLVFCATFSPFNKNTFASVSCDSTLKLWDTACNSRSIMTLKDVDNAELLSCDWSHCDPNVVVTGSSEGSVKGFDIRKMTKAVFELFGCESAIRRVQCSYDAPYRLAVSSFDNSTRVFNAIESQEPIETFYNHSEFAYGM